MHDAATVLTGVAAVLGAGLLLYGGLAGMRSWRASQHLRAAQGRFWLGLFTLVETGPRLAGWPVEVVLALSVLALVPLLLALRSLQRT